MVDPESMPLLIAMLGAAAMAAVVFVFMFPYISGSRHVEKRVASVTENRVKSTSSRTAAEVAANRKKQVADSLKDIESRQRTKERVTLRLRLQRAGFEPDPKPFWIASGVSGALCAILVFTSMPSSPMLPIAAMTASFIGTFGLPRWVLTKLIAGRQKKFLGELANAIDVVVRGVKSGLPLGECLQIISRESPEPIASEFKEVVEQQRVGVPLSEALDRLVQRMPTPEVKFLTIVISIQQQAGGNLSEALGNLSGVLRDRLRMQMKVKALSAEAKSSALVLGSLPPGVMFMVYSTAPDYIMPLFLTRTGHLFLLGSAFWMSCGVLVMRKMINFKY